MKRAAPSLPKVIKDKISKTGQTRGADDDEVFQNRVLRNSTAIIPYRYFSSSILAPNGESGFERGYIVLISPEDYFAAGGKSEIAKKGLVLGKNALVFYERREDWEKFNPKKLGWKAAASRVAPLGGNFIARIAATTALNNGGKILEGYSSTKPKGAGIRVYEYASTKTIDACRHQLEFLFWSCKDSVEVCLSLGMDEVSIASRSNTNSEYCAANGLSDLEALKKLRFLNAESHTVCPLCLEPLSARGFASKMQQADGREVHDLTITELNLFHLEELRVGRFNHRPYNLGWGHHHCNVVTKDVGIEATIAWMRRVVERNKIYFKTSTSLGKYLQLASGAIHRFFLGFFSQNATR